MALCVHPKKHTGPVSGIPHDLLSPEVSGRQWGALAVQLAAVFVSAASPGDRTCVTTADSPFSPAVYRNIIALV